jgi:hypothetical protein
MVAQMVTWYMSRFQGSSRSRPVKAHWLGLGVTPGITLPGGISQRRPRGCYRPAVHDQRDRRRPSKAARGGARTVPARRDGASGGKVRDGLQADQAAFQL